MPGLLRSSWLRTSRHSPRLPVGKQAMPSWASGVADTVDPLETLNKAIENVKPRLEVKSRRVGGATYQVPMEVPSDRQVALAMRWIVNFAKGRKGVRMENALAYELRDAASGQGSAIKKRDDMHKMAQANRAFAHFRW